MGSLNSSTEQREGIGPENKREKEIFERRKDKNEMSNGKNPELNLGAWKECFHGDLVSGS